MNNINKEKFWQEYSEFLTTHKDQLVGPDKKKTEDFPLSGSTFYKSTSDYQHDFPRDKTFVPVMEKVFNDKSPHTWLSQLNYEEIKKYIDRKFVTNNKFSIYIDDITESPSVYESYIIATTTSLRGIKCSELEDGLGFIRATVSQSPNDLEATVNRKILDGYKSFSQSQINHFIEKELIYTKDGLYHFYKKNIHISSILHSYNLKIIENIKPFFHKQKSSIEGNANVNLSLSRDRIPELREDLLKVLKKYSDDEISSPDEDSEILRISMSLTKLTFDEFIGEGN